MVWSAMLLYGAWHYVRQAISVELGFDGVLVFHRPLMGTVRVRTDQVRRVHRGRFGGYGSQSSLHLEYGDDKNGRSTVLLAWGFPEVFELITELRRHNPHLEVADP